MFACETLLKNGNLATLELYNNQPRWWIKDAILTDRGFYLFQEKGDLLGEEYDFLEMSQFRQSRIGVEAPPAYSRSLPPFKTPYVHLIEMHNKKTQKRRVIACDTAASADEYMNLMNLVNSYLTYELLFKEDNFNRGALMAQQIGEETKTDEQSEETTQQKKGGPIFITQWVQSYLQHNGVLEFKDEVFDPENFPYLLSFGRDNEAIKQMVFNETFIFAGNEDRCLNVIQQILSTFNRESITAIILRGNYLVDNVLKQIIPSVSQYERLTVLEISNNAITNQSLETIGVVFSNCPLVQKIILNNNLLGQGPNQAGAIEVFLNQMLTELDNPQQLDLTDNKFTDESLPAFIRFIFANEDCKLNFFSLENNQFTAYGKRTLLKAYSLSYSKSSLKFKCGPLPFTEATMKHAFNVQYETKIVGKGKDQEQQKVVKSMNSDVLEMVISRKPIYGQTYIRGLPINKSEREKMVQIFGKIENTVVNRHQVFIEDIRDLLQEISALNFEFPRHKLESLFDVVNEKLFQSIECENIYCLEILLDCLRFMNARNVKAEEKYAELSVVAASIAKDIIKVINMELLDDNELNTMLDNALNEAKRIGMRGEILDIAVTLKMMRNNFLQEMQNRSGNSDEEEDQQLVFYDEDKTMNVFDEKYDQFIDMPPEELGLTSEVESNLGFHPYSTDYLKISQLNLNYVKKNLKEAQKFLRDEESYAYRNIFDRCYFLLCDPNETSASSKAYNLAKNDSNLKMSRIIFRYRNNLDNLFNVKPEPQLIGKNVNAKRQSMLLTAKGDETKIYQYKNLQAKEYIEFNGTKLSHPVTKLDKTRVNTAVAFNRQLFAICETDDMNKNTLYQKIQELIEEFACKKSKIVNEDLADEFYLQIYRQINRKNIQQSERSAKAIAHALFILGFFSRYILPSKDLMESYEQWMISLRDKTGSEFFRLIQIILNNFYIIKKADPTQKPAINWPPCFAEIEALITGEPIQIQVYTPPGDIFQYTVDYTTTVESLLCDHIWKEKFFQKEPDCEFYWLYQHVEKSDHFDNALSKDKKILKILYQTEKENKEVNRESSDSESMLSSGKRYSFMRKKTSKFMRKQTIVASSDILQDNEYQGAVFIIRKRIFSSLHIDKNVKTLAKKALNFLYHQVRLDYVEKNLLRRLSNYEDVSLFAALIFKVKYWGKILRSKDNTLSKELIIKNIDYALPASFLREKTQDYWVSKIQKDFERNNLRELSIEEAQEKFLNLFATYHLAYSSYYVLKATPNISNDKNDSLDLDDLDDNGGPESNRDTFLSKYMNNDLLMVVNFSGISFYENLKRDKIIQKVNYEDLLYVMGSSEILKIGFISRASIKIVDTKIELYTTNGQGARSISEDIVAYCQIRLAECAKNEQIEIVKRNIINIFEDMEDPFADEADLGSPSPFNRSGHPTFKQRKSTNNSPPRKNKFDYYGDEEGNQNAAEVNNNNSQLLKSLAQQAQHRLMQLRGQQFRLKEKLLIYMKKFPLHNQKVGGSEQKSPENSNRAVQYRGSISSGSFGRMDRNSMFKLQLSTQRIEEDKEEDEDDSSYLTGEDGNISQGYHSNNTSKTLTKGISPIGTKTSTTPIGTGKGNLRGASRIKDSSPLSSSTNKSQILNDEMNKSKEQMNPAQMAVYNELFKTKTDNNRKESDQRGFSLHKNSSGQFGEPPAEEVKQGEAMILGNKVNYEEMDKGQKKENLNSLLSAAFNILPPPPK